MLLNQMKDSVDLARAHAVALRQFDTRLKPELRFAAGAAHVDVHPRLLAREEVEAEPTFADTVGLTLRSYRQPSRIVRPRLD